jgi:hypothetical protein
MRFPSILLAVLLCGLAAGDQSQLSSRYQTVFIRSMANSMDQHLASRLTSNRVLWVVLQPSNADAVITESLDDDFWGWLERAYPAPANAPGQTGLRGQGYSGKPSGTIFLIDPRNRLVLWSMYELPRNSSPAELDRSATRISAQLRMAFGKR